MGLSEKMTEIKSECDALITYANGVTGESDTSVGDCIASLVAGYGGGGGLVEAETVGEIIPNKYLANGVEQTYNGWSISPYYKCGLNNVLIFVARNGFTLGKPIYNAIYDESFSYVNNKLSFAGGTSNTKIKSAQPESDCEYVRISCVSSFFTNLDKVYIL